MDESSAVADNGGVGSVNVRGRHIKKRSLKNKSLTVSFNEKDLKDFVDGFHKRKKKRRREALQKQEEAARKKRIELRKKRKLERDAAYGTNLPDFDGETVDYEHEDDEAGEELPSLSGTVTYDTGDVQVMVTTSDIGQEKEYPDEKPSFKILDLEKSKQKVTTTRKKQAKKAPRKRPPKDHTPRRIKGWERRTVSVSIVIIVFLYVIHFNSAF